MKCLIFAEFSLTGGTRAYLKDLLVLHRKNNIKTEVVFPVTSADPDMINHIKENRASYTLVADRKPIYKKSYFSLWYEFRKYYPIIKRSQPDLILVSTATPGENFCLFFSRTPSIYIMHTPAHKATSKNRFMFIIPRMLSGKRKRISTVSSFVKNTVVEYWKVPFQNIDVVYNSYRIGNCINTGAEQKIVLTLGHVVYYKNPILWLEIARKVKEEHPDVEFIWLGDGELLDQFQKEAKSLKGIDFLGHKNNISIFYEKAFLYLQPSIKESLGISVLDAMACGIPCIVSDAEGLPETIEDAVSGYVCSNESADRYVAAINKLLDDQQQRDKMGENAKERAQHYFHPHTQEKKILALYESIFS